MHLFAHLDGGAGEAHTAGEAFSEGGREDIVAQGVAVSVVV